MGDAARRRLLVAVLVSAALHLSLMFGVAVRRPIAPLASEPIVARIDRVAPASAAHPEATSRPTARRARSHAPSLHSAPAVLADTTTAAAAVAAPADALPPVEMPLLADPTWYLAAQLDVLPSALEPVRPDYPEVAAANAGGEVILLLLVDENGRVHECSVVDAQPEGLFEEAALDALRAARFAPASKDGRSVRSRVLVKVVFNPAQAAAGTVAH